MRLRKLVTRAEETFREMGREVSPPARRAVAAAVIANPYAGRHAEALDELVAAGEALGQMLAEAALGALGVAGGDVQGFGKAALVGEAGEVEHAAAVLHPAFGAPVRALLGRGKALIPSSKSLGAPGAVIDVPLGHVDAAYVRSHFDGLRLSLNDAPRPGEIVVALALTSGGRPHARVGGLRHEEAVGADGLR